VVQVGCTMASKVYVICTLSTVLCIPSGVTLGNTYTALREQIPYPLQSHGLSQPSKWINWCWLMSTWRIGTVQKGKCYFHECSWAGICVSGSNTAWSDNWI